MSEIRASLILTAFLVLTVPLMPVQAALIYASPRLARRFPHWYHRQVCRLLGVRINVEGQIERDRPVLLVSNHTSWLDIPLLSAVAPVSFVAKKEVGTWPFVSALAKLQRTVFVDREKRAAVGDTASEIVNRLRAGDAIVLFAEGTSSDGNRVLPFMTSLFGAAKPSGRAIEQGPHDAQVQTLSIVYTHLHGVRLNRADRPIVSWYGDMEMTSHAWQLLKAGPLNATVKVGPPLPLESFADRKDLAARSEAAVRENVVRILRARSPDDPIEIAKIDEPVRLQVRARDPGDKWR
jgi:1-acyl-sn-glycerol-3-phosphate acyltransferase